MYSLPTEYSFVALSLDPEATVSDLKNELLTAACRRLQRKTFVAYVGERRQFFMPWEPHHSWQFYLVFQALRKEDPALGIEPQMSVPVLPNTSHPLHREPLDPGYALPWNDCYISESIQFNARVVTRMTEEPVYCATSEEAERIQGYFDEDSKRRRELKPQILAARAIMGKENIERRDVESESPWGFGEEEHGSTAEARGKSSASASIDASLERSNEDEAKIMLDELTAQPRRNLFVVEVSFDLSSAELIHEPDEFFQEVASLTKLTIELENARKQREIMNAQRIDQEYFAAIQEGRSRPPRARKCMQSSV
ncbi:hypothetical protein J3R30DRAFT_3294311 [Lentinula aciculospora]|uniref:Uncharacterized protein n=1 Tax=Lentinula aciculospora TaxID=153920 RepID=A0A9W9A6L0_9AGAR|nr:hypothetical protein J3R30DRAFT_3294311 [Lentinula aciculospora]